MLSAGLREVVASDGEIAFGNLRGDLNHDGNVDLVDIDLLLWAINQGVEDELFDLNGDDVVDNLTGGDLDQLILYIVKTYYGDANLDGQFNSADMAAVFGVGEYEDGDNNNSGWAEGDWNGDGDFDSSDFSFAFGEGGYDQPNRGGGAFATHQTIIGYTSRPLDLVTGVQRWRKRERPSLVCSLWPPSPPACWVRGIGGEGQNCCRRLSTAFSIRRRTPSGSCRTWYPGIRSRAYPLSARYRSRRSSCARPCSV